MGARIAKTYMMPDGITTTQDIDQYIQAWHAIAQPIEDQLGMKMIAFDPEFIFAQGNPQRPGIKTVQLPPWFVHRLSEHLQPVVA